MPESSLPRRTVSLLAGVALLGMLQAVLVYERVAEQWLIFVFEVDRHLIPGELIHYALLLVLGLPAALALSSAWSQAGFQRFGGWFARAGYWLPALVATLTACCLSRFVTHGAWFTDDEQAYMFQVQSYQHLALSVPALQPESLFHHPFVVVSQIKQGVAYWAGCYPPLQPLLMTLCSYLGDMLISQWLCVGLIAQQAGLLGEALTGERRAGLIASWLCATSPMLIGLASSYHTSVLACLLSLLTLRAALAAGAHGRCWRGALVGLGAGATFLTRGLEGTLMVLVAGGLMLWQLRARPRAAALSALGFSLSGALAFAIYMAVNRGSTGAWLDTTYAVWARQMGPIMGFGQAMMWGRVHTPLQAMAQTFTTLVRMNTWLFGWPVSLLVPLLGAFRALCDRPARWLLGLSALQLSGHVLLAFGSVHDFGAAYHVWHVPWLAVVCASVLKHATRVVVPAPRIAFSLSLVALLSFWPVQLEKWRTTAARVLVPVRAAERAAAGRPVFVLWSTIKPGGFTWVNHPPSPFPDSPIVWAHDVPGAAEYLRRAYPERAVLRLTWEGGQPRVLEATAP